MYRAVDQYILKIVDLGKVVVHADSGKILSLFLNVSLACDYRVVAEDSVFQNPCLELGLVPKGGGAFFLSKMLGPSKAIEILLSGEDITAQEALRLGVVDMVVPLHELEEAALNVTRRFSHVPVTCLAGVKRLVSYSLSDLAPYLEQENHVLTTILESPQFSRSERKTEDL